MYSTRLRDDRYYVHCVTVLNRPKVMQFLFDTGAKYTCCSFRALDDDLKEEDFSDALTKDLGGFVAGSAMRFYQCQLKQFSIGTIDLGRQSIWITFDKRISDSVLGMDIIKDIAFKNSPGDHVLYLEKA